MYQLPSTVSGPTPSSEFPTLGEFAPKTGPLPTILFASRSGTANVPRFASGQ